METNDKKPEGVEEVDEVKEIVETKDEFENDTTDWKNLALENQGIAKRFRTKNTKLKEEFDSYKTANPEEKKEEEKPQDKKDFDLAEKSYLMGSGIKKGEIPFVWEEAQKTGKSIDEILESPYFQEKLEQERSKEAMPSESKRSAGTVSDSVDYWMKKGQYPPNTPENTELRRRVANALVKQTEDKQKFSSNPIT